MKPPNGIVKDKGAEAEELIKRMAMEEVRKSAQELKASFMGQMEARVSKMLDEVVDSIETSDLTSRLLSKPESSMSDKRRINKAGGLPEKEFKSRPSVLTELLQVPHFQTIYHIFIAVLILIMIHTLIVDFLETGSCDLGLERLIWAFGNPLLPIKLLLVMHSLATFLVYPTFYFWANQRTSLNLGLRRVFDCLALGGGIAFFLAFIYFPAAVILDNNIRPALSSACCMEQTRLLMKMYAFIRSNTPRALNFTLKAQTNQIEATSPNGKNPQEVEGLRRRLVDSNTKEDNHNKEMEMKQDKYPCPEFSKYLYFLFAPTLIYKDSYPRTNKIRWNYVFWNFSQVIGCIIYSNFLLHRFCSLYFSKFGLEPMELKELINALFIQVIPGIVLLMLSFFTILHCWPNAWSEMLCFGDRLFYKDWWNRGSFQAYYRTWNVLVHDFLYHYVFKDASENGLGKVIPTVLVFVISSIFHEYILAISLHFLYPILLVLFGGIGLLFAFVRMEDSALGNIFMWFGLFTGTGLIIGLYSLEYYARQNCQPYEHLDFFKPRSWNCNAIIS